MSADCAIEDSQIIDDGGDATPGPAPIEVILLGSTQSHWAADIATTSMLGVGGAVGLGASHPVGRHELKLNRSGASDQLADTDAGSGATDQLPVTDGGFLPVAHLADVETQGWGICLQGPRLTTAEGKKSGGMERTFVTPCPTRVPAQKSEKGGLGVFDDDGIRSLGGCPPPTDETGMSKLREGAFVSTPVSTMGR